MRRGDVAVASHSNGEKIVKGEGWFLSGISHSGWDGWKDEWLRHGIFQ